MPRGLHGAISGILAGGILGFCTADRFLFSAPSPRSCCDVWLCVFLLFARSNSPPNSSAQSCPLLLRARPSLRGDFVVLFVFFCFLGLFCLFCGLFVSLFGWHPLLDLSTAYWSTLSFDSTHSPNHCSNAMKPQENSE